MSTLRVLVTCAAIGCEQRMLIETVLSLVTKR